MLFEWFGFQTPPSLNTSFSLTGILIIVVYLMIAILVFVRNIHSLRTALPGRLPLFAGLLLIAPLLAQVAILHPVGNTTGASIATSAALFSLLPLGAAALLLGTTPAMLVGLVTGLTWALFSTGRITQPFELALMAAAVAWLVRQPYRGLLAHFMRQPLAAMIVAVLVVGWLLGLVGIFATTSSSELYSLEVTLQAFGPLLILLLLMSTAAGLLLQALFMWRSEWNPVQADDLILPPWQQNLSHRVLFTLSPLILLSIIALVGVLSFTAYQVATRLVIGQMMRDASNAGENIPFFIQVGRSLIRDLAQDPALADTPQNVSAEYLAEGLRAVPFFQQLVYFDKNGQAVASYPETSLVEPDTLAEENTRVQTALTQSVPAEVVITPDMAGADVVMSFVSPVVDPTTGEVLGVLVGRTQLGANPTLAPVIEILRSSFIGSGVGFLIDDQNRILLHPADPARQQNSFELNAASEIAVSGDGRAFRQRQPDSTQSLIYMLPVEGRNDWSVVVAIPNQVVLQLAAQIAVPMLLLLLLLALTAIPLTVLVMRRITGPLNNLLVAVDALSEGELTHPVQVTGHDEIGRLGTAFEQMRTRLKARLNEQERLLRVSRSVSSSLELFRAMPPILSSALEVSNAAGVRVVVRRISDEPFPTYAAGEAAAVIATLDEQLMELVERQGTVVISQLWRATSSLDITALPSGIQAIVALPLRSETSFHGIFWLAYDHEHSFDQSEMTFLSTLASQAAVAIANARLFAEAEEERRKLAAVLESTADAMIVADQQGRVVLLNPAAERYLGIRAEQATGKRVEDVIEAPELTRLLTDLQEPVSALEMPGQRGRALLANVSTMFTHDGTITGRVAVLRDITALKELDNIKTVFLRMVSHDLRSPLTYMRGYLSLLPLSGELNERQVEAVGKVTNGIDAISDMTERLLNLSRLQFGEEAELQMSMIDVETLINTIITQQEPFAQERSIRIHLIMEERLPLVAADEMLYRQAVANLVTNALKYTPEGGEVVIRAFQVGDNGEKNITIAVEDTGIGIREEDQPRLFEAFFRVPQREGEPARPRGTGLGLALVKAIANAHGGNVGVQSEFGHGSIFHITLPAKGAEDL
jgi:two-component system, OmpR family, phosphate regulon sensor histidine kinase PhoR